jgi:CheY-like chemotaxis protein
VARFRTSVALLVTDVVMPHMSGVELAADLRARWPSLRVLFTSGYTERVDSQLPRTPADRFLPKPFTPAALRRQVEELLAAA